MRFLPPGLAKAAVLGCSIWAALVGRVAADPIPEGWRGKDVAPVGYSDLGGRAAFKLAIKRTADGRWYLFAASLTDPGWHILDVTRPEQPTYVRFVEGPAGFRTTQVSVHGDLLVTGLGAPLDPDVRAGVKPFVPGVVDGGALFWDVSDPANPRQVSAWRGMGRATHRNSYPGGRYAYLSASERRWTNNFLLILDVRDPKAPREAGRWWGLGQRKGEPRQARVPGFHGPANLSPDGRMLTLGYYPWLLNLDVTDPARPREIGKLQFVPPFSDFGAQALHTALPLWDRGLVFVSGEQRPEGCASASTSFAALVDNKDPAAPRLLSILPAPRPPPGASYASFCDKPGRFGPHNVSQEIHSPDVQQPGRFLPVTYFNAGLRIFDIADASAPQEVGWFLPPAPRVRRSPSPRILGAMAEDVLVDARGYLYLSDAQWGVFVLKHTPDVP